MNTELETKQMTLSEWKTSHLETSNFDLFTYKVAFDGGTAPNPFGKYCSLAICKPGIRKSAIRGDIIVGFSTDENRIDPDRNRIVYLMIVADSVDWAKYGTNCRSDKDLKIKIPTSKNHQGDCIWNPPSQTPLKSYSGHETSDYKRDVETGGKVLIGSTFWYFGDGKKKSIQFPAGPNFVLNDLVPRRQGYRRSTNDHFKVDFINWFLKEVESGDIPNGIHGNPTDGPGQEDEKIEKCRRYESLSDNEAEES
jgi:hypothetical protein